MNDYFLILQNVFLILHSLSDIVKFDYFLLLQSYEKINKILQIITHLS